MPIQEFNIDNNEQNPALLRVLIVEDSEDDTLLLVRQLHNAGYIVDYLRVDTELDLRSALADKEWNLLITDFYMPKFSGFDALNVVNDMEIDIPTIVVSGVVGEEKAVEMMVAGAHDYVMKHNLQRLVPAIRREIAEADIRRQRREAQAELERYQNHLEELVQERTRELQNIQSELIQKQRMAVLGQLVATVSHELCNPLGVIRNGVFLMHKKLGADHVVCKDYLAMIEREVDAAHQIISNLLEATRAKEPQQQIISLDEVIDELLVSLDVLANVTFEFQRNPKPYMIYADKLQMRQVFNNLISNSMQSANSDGLLLIKAFAQKEKDFIYVADNGSGIPKEMYQSIFEPLFTTKPKGNGLGLWITKEIVSRHNGSIEIIEVARCSDRHTADLSDAFAKAAHQKGVPDKIGACFRVCIPHNANQAASL